MKARIVTTDDVRLLGTILGVWAHPDDESFVAGGLLAAAAQNGQTVACVTATKGEAGVRDIVKYPPATLGETRAAELQTALGILGVPRHSWLGYADGHCNEATEADAVAQLLALIGQYRPDSIVTFGPDGLTGHDDHRMVSRWAGLAADAAAVRPRIYHAVYTPEQYDRARLLDKQVNLFFNIERPPLVEPHDCAIAYWLPQEILLLKRRAFEAMPSQMDDLLRLLPGEKFNQIFGSEYFVEFKPEDTL